MARTEKALEDFDAGLVADLDLDEAVKMVIRRAEAAESERDAALLELQQIRTMLDDGDNGNASTTLDMVKRLQAECYALRR